MTREEESALIRRVLAGDSDAFEPLVLENQTRVYHLALRCWATRPTPPTRPRTPFCAPIPPWRAFGATAGFPCGSTG
jgi:hypothetical protein